MKSLAHHPLMQFFAYDHLPPFLQQASRPFSDMAHGLAHNLPVNSESVSMLRKLIEAKDCAVRSLLMKDEAQS